MIDSDFAIKSALEEIFPVSGEPDWQEVVVAATAKRRVPRRAFVATLTAAVHDDIPGDWDARRIDIAMRDEDNGRVSMVQS